METNKKLIKLIIEIPEEVKQAFDQAESDYLKNSYYDVGGVIGSAIKNGKPLGALKPRMAYLTTDGDTIGSYYCSDCGGFIGSYDTAYCKWCGAKLVAENEVNNGN